MKAELGNWPVPLSIAAAIVVMSPIAVPDVMAIMLIASCWSLATVSMREGWSVRPGSIRQLHLAVGALSASAFMVPAWSSLPVDQGTFLPRGVLMVSGPIALFVAFALFRIPAAGQSSVDRCDVIDAVTVAVLPWSLVATVVAPWIIGPRSVEIRVTAAAIVWVSAAVFVAGALIVFAGSHDGPKRPFLAGSAVGLGGLGWLAVLSVAAGGSFDELFPRVLIIPAIGYLVAVRRGELAVEPATGPAGRSRPAWSMAEQQSRWMLFAAIGMAVAFVAIVERSIPLVLAVTTVAFLSIARLAVASARIAAAARMIEAFDDFLEPLALLVDEQEIVDRATAAARTLLESSDVFVEVAGRPELTPDFAGRPAVVNSASGAAVISRLGQVQICTLDPIPPERLRSLTRLADIVALALSSVDGGNRGSGRGADEPFTPVPRTIRTAGGTGEVSPLPSASSSRIDVSSGLPNLHDFELQGSIAHAVVIVFYLHDLERVRDSVGSEAGDSFVRRLAVRARRTFRNDEDTVWRGDGAKVIVLSPLDGSAATGTRAAELDAYRREAAVWVEDRRAALSAPTALGMSFIAPAISAGFTVVDGPISPTEALQQAEMALMDARDNHPRSTVAYSAELHARLSREWRIQSFLAAGLDDLAAAGFTVHYQPIIDVASGSVKMVEALSRWDQPELGRVSPAEFIPIAEKSGVVGRIDDFVLARAVEDLRRFRTVAPDLAIQVNMSPTGLEPTRLAEVAKFVLRHLGSTDPGIIIEVTESALSNQPMSELHKAFSFLREANIGIAVDDFGTGESNFERMNKLPFTQVKLANQFVRSSDSLLMTNVVNVVHGMGMNCVVEGVETQAQYDIAARSGADHVQGWHFAAAMPITEALRYCQTRLLESGEEAASLAARPQRHGGGDHDAETDKGGRGDGQQRGAVAGDRRQ